MTRRPPKYRVYNHDLARPEDRFQFESNELRLKLQYALRH